MGGVGVGAQTGDRLCEDHDAHTHGQLFEHRGEADTGDVGDNVHVQLEDRALGELEACILVLLTDGIDGHAQGNGLAHDGGDRCADNFQTGEAQLTVDEDPVEGDVDNIGGHVINHGRF